jgi:hypothetical protein
MARPAPTPLDSGLLIAKGAPPLAPTPATGEPVEVTAPEAVPNQAPVTPAAVAPRRSVLEPKVKPVRVPLTVKIRPETLRRLRLVAVHHEIEQQDIVEEALAQWLDFNEPK